MATSQGELARMRADAEREGAEILGRLYGRRDPRAPPCNAWTCWPAHTPPRAASCGPTPRANATGSARHSMTGPARSRNPATNCAAAPNGPNGNSSGCGARPARRHRGAAVGHQALPDQPPATEPPPQNAGRRFAVRHGRRHSRRNPSEFNKGFLRSSSPAHLSYSCPAFLRPGGPFCYGGQPFCARPYPKESPRGDPGGSP
jgi:hypothetical protein